MRGAVDPPDAGIRLGTTSDGSWTVVVMGVVLGRWDRKKEEAVGGDKRPEVRGPYEEMEKGIGRGSRKGKGN